MRLVPIPVEKYNKYRLDLMFDGYKWDPQFVDNNTIARYALVITEEEHKQLQSLTELLDKETRAAEEFLNNNLELAKPLALTKALSKEISNMKNYKPDEHIRLMRYDFHPTVEDRWAISEVNSDVPGGFAEASIMPKVALSILEENVNELEQGTSKQAQVNGFAEQNKYWFINFGDILAKAVVKNVRRNGRIMLVHCTSYSDDRQVMQFLGDRLKAEGYEVIYGAADHVNFKNNKAYSILDGNEGELDAIFRFTPLEWITDIKPKRWSGYFDTTTTSCNHPIAIFAQTKRFPLCFDILEHNGISMSAWRELLPDTIEVSKLKTLANKDEYIYKPAYGRVGEKISIKEACDENEYKTILAEVKKHPKKYLAQKRFNSMPLTGTDGVKYHVCLGSYAVNGEHAGYYARISHKPRIDSYAADIPVLIEREVGNDR